MRLRSLSVAVVLAAVLFPAVGSAANIHVKLAKPPPGRYGIEELWKATVTSDTACDAWFEGSVFEETRGRVFWAKTRPFPLPRGTRLYQYRDVQIERTETATGYEMFVTRSGQLPAGTYRFVLILRPFGVGDSFTFDVKPMGPPRLILPRDGDTVKQKYPVFSWTPPAPMPAGGVTYELKLVEIRPGQSAEEALAANPVWFEKKDIRTTSLTYPTSARQLEDMPIGGQGGGKLYAAPETEDMPPWPHPADTAKKKEKAYAAPETEDMPPWPHPADTAKKKEKAYAARQPDTEDWPPHKAYAWQVTAKARDGAASRSEARSFALAPAAGEVQGSKSSVAATVVWQHRQLGVPWDIWYADFDEDLGVTAPAPLAVLPGPDADPAIAYDRTGAATVVWAHRAPGTGQKFGIYWSRRTASTWSPAALLCPGAQSDEYDNIDPAIAFDEDGKGLCVWVRVCEPPGNRHELFYSEWDGSSWSDTASVYELPPGPDPFDTTFRVPEITFAKSGRAVVLAIAKGHPFDPLAQPTCVYIPWTGSGWGTPNPIPGSEGAFLPEYQDYPSPPALHRISIAADNQGQVHARWRKQGGYTLGATGTHSGGWSWTWPSAVGVGPGQRTAAVVTDDASLVKTVFQKTTRVWDETGFLPPGPAGPAGRRPAAAWLTSNTPGVLAVWHTLNSPYNWDIWWSFWNRSSGTWTPLPVTVSSPGLTGRDRNPDIAAKSGSHTMPPQP